MTEESQGSERLRDLTKVTESAKYIPLYIEWHILENSSIKLENAFLFFQDLNLIVVKYYIFIIQLSRILTSFRIIKIQNISYIEIPL